MSFGGSNFFAQPPAGKAAGSIFGPTGAGTSTLGSFGTQSQSQPAQGSIYGNPAGQQQQPQQQSSLFPNLGQQQQQQQSTTSFLGQSLAGQQQQQQPQAGQQSNLGGSIFGGGMSNQQQQQPAQQQPNLFSGFGGLGTSTAGGGNAQGQQFAGFGNLGSSTAPSLGGFGTTNASTNSIFGNRQLSQQPTQPNFGGFGMGGSFLNKQPSQQPVGPFSNTQNTQSAVVPQFTKSTKFNDLPDQVKKIFEDIDAHIQGRVQISKDLKQRKVGEEATKGQDLIRSVHKDLLNTISVLQSDVRQTRDIKAKVDQTVQDTIVATHIVDGFRNPQQSGTYLKNHANFPLEFFNRVTEEMRERLEWCKNAIEAIERKLSSAVSQVHYTPQAITSTLEAQHSSFVQLANKTASLDAELQKIKALYTQLWRAKTGSMRDPFNELDRGTGKEFGMESLNGK